MTNEKQTHTPTPYYLNGNEQMHGRRWIADARNGGKPLTDDWRAVVPLTDGEGY